MPAPFFYASVQFAWDHVAPEFRPPWWLFFLATALGIGTFVVITYLGTHDRELLAGLVAFGASIGLWVATRLVFDHVAPWASLDPRTQSWALLWDTALAFAIALAAIVGRNYLDPGGWRTRWWWAPLAYALAWLIGWAVRFWMDYPGYGKHRLWALIFDPAKVLHDEWTWPCIAAALIYFGLPVLLAKVMWVGDWSLRLAPITLIVVVLVWVALGNLHDRNLDVHVIQTAYNYLHWEPVPNWLP